MTTIRLALSALALATAACHVGTSAKSFAPAQDPHGIQAEITLTDASRFAKVELLALQDSAVIALLHPTGAPARLLLIPVRQIAQAWCPSMSGSDFVSDGKYVAGDVRAQINLLARYPQGISPQLMTLLLTDYHQAALGVVGGG